MVEERGYYLVKIHGEYFAQVGEKKELRGYKLNFKLPNADEPLGVIKGKLLMPTLNKMDPSATSVYTHFVDEIVPVNLPFDPNLIPYRFQSREQLRKFCQLHKLPINVDEFGSLGTLRDHVRVAKEEPENYPALAAKHKKKVDAERELYELNKDVFDTAEVGTAVPLTQGGSGKPAPTIVGPVPSSPSLSGRKPVYADSTPMKSSSEKFSVDGKADPMSPEDILS